jgi:Xaa-Pro aminopeptidase
MTDENVISDRLERLRSLLRENELDALIVKREDEHLSEYIAPENERLAYISGFTGSAGTAVILKEADFIKHQENKIWISDSSGKEHLIKNSCALFVDGRYVLQAQEQAPANFYDIFHFKEITVACWLKSILRNNKRIGFDPKCISGKEKEELKKELEYSKIILIPTESNLIDLIWPEKAENKPGKAYIYEDKYNGCPSIEKRHLIAEELKKRHLDATIISKSESVNWLLNVRGHDVPCLPVVNSFLAVYNCEHVEWYVSPQKIRSQDMSDFQHHFGNIDYYSEDELVKLAERLGKEKASVYVDPRYTNSWLMDLLDSKGCKIVPGPDFCEMPKAKKNPTEIQGMKRSHLRDAVAMCRFLAWLDQLTMPLITESSDEQQHSSKWSVARSFDEAKIADQLFKFRKEQKSFLENSFDTISALGPNASIVHYNHINLGHPRPLGKDPMYLVDSGGHYADGTTDITRTVLVGPGLTSEMQERFTLVLKGLIALHSIHFPKGTCGTSLDVLARAPLWQNGLDYDHSTGHGVGQCLNVHEGPQSISQHSETTPLEPGMVTSIEPGFYKNGEYGIRCENLSVVETVRVGEYQTEMMNLTPITFVPFDIRLIRKEMLTEDEKQWINSYHMQVREIVKEHLSDFEISWLLKATAAI